MFSLICTGNNNWVNNRDVGDLRRHCAHHDVTLMVYSIIMVIPLKEKRWKKQVCRFLQNINIDLKYEVWCLYWIISISYKNIMTLKRTTYHSRFSKYNSIMWFQKMMMKIFWRRYCYIYANASRLFVKHCKETKRRENPMFLSGMTVSHWDRVTHICHQSGPW